MLLLTPCGAKNYIGTHNDSLTHYAHIHNHMPSVRSWVSFTV